MLLTAARYRSSSLSGDLCVAASCGGCSLESGDEVPVARVPVSEAGEIVVACDARREIMAACRLCLRRPSARDYSIASTRAQDRVSPNFRVPESESSSDESEQSNIDANQHRAKTKEAAQSN
ncbi:hypothetical protein EJB05_11463 [Eragrostis curvula]|uniref:Uncharacterized protein n=1 Tax=Eragrostis curvula TaxID=38414 RepID=A0A5J9VPD0_9POAL|nr:hypothetical protein EJB05_11463 [Eragrostis curvula]